MIVFLDTSSLVKIYHGEDGSDRVTGYVDDTAIKAIYLSELAKIEFSSAIWKKVRSEEISSDEATEVLKMFEDDENAYQWIPIDKEIIQMAKKKVTDHGLKGLRTLDSIQLASCLCVISRADENAACLCCDNLLSEVMQEENIEVISS